jgi:hypothetical protein
MREIQLGSEGAINPHTGLARRSLLEPNYRVYQIRRREGLNFLSFYLGLVLKAFYRASL